jgi:hypothetical protein
MRLFPSGGGAGQARPACPHLPVWAFFLAAILLAVAGPGLLCPRLGAAEETVQFTALAPAAPTTDHKRAHSKPELFLRLQPYFTRDPLVAARSPLDVGEHYQSSPLNPHPRIFGVGVIAAYPVTPWLQLHSAYRLNLTEPTVQGIGTAAHARETLSHSLFLGISIPFSPPLQ